MASLMPNGKQQYFDNNGDPLSGGKLYTYASGTSTPKSTYTTAAASVANANPVILDSRGEATIFWSGIYKVVLKDSNDVEIYSVDGVSESSAALPEIGSYAELRAYNGAVVAQYVRGVANILDGGFGTFRVDSSDTTSADNGGTILVDALGRRWKREFAGDVNVKWFGAVANGITDDTVAIQSAIYNARDLKRRTFIPGGRYLFSQLVIPTSIEVYGSGIGGYGSTSPSYTFNMTLLIQKSGVNDDAIIFDMPIDSGFYRLFNVNLHDFVLSKSGTTDTIGNGISIRQVGTDRNISGNHGIINAVCSFERFLVRGFPENGMYSLQGAAPMYCSDLDFIFNGGYGLRIDGANYMRNVVLRNIAGDGNKAGAVVRVASNTSDNLVTLDGIFGEFRSDNPYGNTPGFAGAQPDAVEIGSFGTANNCITVNNAYANSIVTDTAPRSVIFVNTSGDTTTPVVTFQGLTSRKSALSLGTKYSLYDNRTTFSIPSTVRAGAYSVIDYPIAFPSGFTVFGDGTVSKPPVGTEGVQVKGAFPNLSWFETDAGTNNKGWLFGPSAGNLYIRTFDDALSTSDIVQTYFRSGGLVTRVEFQKELRATAAFAATGILTYADNAAATAGGLPIGYVYKTATGEVRIRV